MKKIIISIIVALIFCMPSHAFAASENADCFKYYKFQSGLEFNDLHAEKVSYAPGENVRVFYNLLSHMDAPIVEGKVRVQIFYDGPEDIEHMVDEFISEDDISLYRDDKIPFYFKWKIPAGAKGGKYTVKTYFIVGEKFNLVGISMLPYGPPGVPGEMTTFNVKNSDDESRIYLDKESTTINDNKYTFGANSPSFDASTPLSIETKLVNEGTAKKQVTLKMNVYEWDDVTERPIAEYSQEKIIVLEANGAEDIRYDLPALKTGAYEVKFVATSADEKSILKMRLAVSGSKGGIGYLGIDRFPLETGEKTIVFACVSNTADHSSTFEGHGTVEIRDKSGNTIYTDVMDARIISADPMGVNWEFVPKESANYLTLKMRLYDKNDNMADEITLIYDYSKFKNTEKTLNVDTDKSRYKQGDTLRYTVTFKDDENNNLRGNILAYIMNPDGDIIHRVKDQNIDGRFDESIKIYGAEGSYKIVARETNHDLAAETSIALAVGDAGVEPKVPDGEGSFNSVRALVVIFSITFLVAAFLLMQARRNKKEGGEDS